MGVGKGNHMVDIKIASDLDDDPRVEVEPPTGCYDAFPGVGEHHRPQGFIYQDFCPRILAVSVGVNPSSPGLLSYVPSSRGSPMGRLGTVTIPSGEVGIAEVGVWVLVYGAGGEVGSMEDVGERM